MSQTHFTKIHLKPKGRRICGMDSRIILEGYESPVLALDYTNESHFLKFISGKSTSLKGTIHPKIKTHELMLFT